MGKLGCSTRILIPLILVVLVLFVIGFVSGALGKSLLGGKEFFSFLSVERPHIQLPAEEISHPLFSLGHFEFILTNTILASWITLVVLLILAFAATRRMRLIPSGVQNILEAGLEVLFNFVTSVAGEKNGRRFFPVIATIFLFVIVNAWLSLLPGFGSVTIKNPEGHFVPLLRGANTDINVPLAIALMSFIFVEYWGFSSQGWKYITKFINVGKLLRGKFMGIVDAFVGVLEALSELIRILSFTLRLFGNMTAGEILLLVIVFLVPLVVAPIFYGLELFIGFVQALIFSGLTLVFATLAVAGHGEEHK